MDKATILQLNDAMKRGNHNLSEEEYYDLSRNSDFVPDSIETLKAIDNLELMITLMENDSFFNATVELCGDIIDKMMDDTRKAVIEEYKKDPYYSLEYELMKKVVTHEEFFKNYYFQDRDRLQISVDRYAHSEISGTPIPV